MIKLSEIEETLLPSIEINETNVSKWTKLTDAEIKDYENTLENSDILFSSRQKCFSFSYNKKTYVQVFYYDNDDSTLIKYVSIDEIFMYVPTYLYIETLETL